MSVISLEAARKRLAKNTKSKSQSSQSSPTEERGPIHTDEEIEELATILIARKSKAILDAAWQGTFTTKSDLARTEADWVALSASLGLITVMTSPDTFSRSWMITEDGLETLAEINELLGEPYYED